MQTQRSDIKTAKLPQKEKAPAELILFNGNRWVMGETKFARAEPLTDAVDP
jgi:hypothetical protein